MRDNTLQRRHHLEQFWNPCSSERQAQEALLRAQSNLYLMFHARVCSAPQNSALVNRMPSSIEIHQPTILTAHHPCQEGACEALYVELRSARCTDHRRPLQYVQRSRNCLHLHRHEVDPPPQTHKNSTLAPCMQHMPSLTPTRTRISKMTTIRSHRTRNSIRTPSRTNDSWLAPVRTRWQRCHGAATPSG